MLEQMHCPLYVKHIQLSSRYWSLLFLYSICTISFFLINPFFFFFPTKWPGGSCGVLELRMRIHINVCIKKINSIKCVQICRFCFQNQIRVLSASTTHTQSAVFSFLLCHVSHVILYTPVCSAWWGWTCPLLMTTQSTSRPLWWLSSAPPWISNWHQVRAYFTAARLNYGASLLLPSSLTFHVHALFCSSTPMFLVLPMDPHF